MIPSVKELIPTTSSGNPFKLATVTRIANSQYFVRPDGEEMESGKPYKNLKSYSPTAGDRVLMASVGGTYVILGKI